MKTTVAQNQAAARMPFGRDASNNHSGRFSRGLSDGMMLSVVALIVVFQVADRVLGRDKASGRLKVT